jgi:hypothetical protein
MNIEPYLTIAQKVDFELQEDWCTEEDFYSIIESYDPDYEYTHEGKRETFTFKDGSRLSHIRGIYFIG